MNISSIYIQNFRKLWQCRIDFGKETTLFVGANNSGKTSAMDALGKFLAGRNFGFNDFTISNRDKINTIGKEWTRKESEMPTDLAKWAAILPTMDVWMGITNNEIHYVANIIPTLKWRGGKLGIRLVFQPKDISKLFSDYREAYCAARTTEAARTCEGTSLNLYPKDLCEFLERKLATYFTLKSYVLDPKKLETDPPQATPYDMECFTDNPLRKIVRIDMIDAQRGFSDPDSSDGGEKPRTQLSTQMRSYYDKHLDPEKSPSPEDLEILEATEDARSVFDNKLADKFRPAILELESLGYPGVTDPKITITTKVSTSVTLKHESAVQYALSKNDSSMRLPEKYNGLGYQNLISMVFDLMSFRDGWMRKGKIGQSQDSEDTIIEPLHLVLIEEPEAHLHMQVQQVFIRKAYTVLRNHERLTNHSVEVGAEKQPETEEAVQQGCEGNKPKEKEESRFSTQLVISTHSSHVVRESDFGNLRYFKRLSESDKCSIATAKVINLSDVFGKEDETDKFVTRYLQTTHCDLFFADAAILVEGSAESMLVPHFIRNKYHELNQRYITILTVNGRHSHRFSPLIEKLCLPTLVISDLDTARPEGHHKSTRPERGKGIISSNYAIAEWLVKEKLLDKLLDAPAERKVFEYKTPFKHTIRIAYQTPVTVSFNQVSTEALSSTFEDCLIYVNLELIKNSKVTDAGSLVKKACEIVNAAKSFDEVHANIYSMLRDCKSDQKAVFALDMIYSFDPKDIAIPPYIVEGLEWLQTLLRPEE